MTAPEPQILPISTSVRIMYIMLNGLTELNKGEAIPFAPPIACKVPLGL